MISTPAEPSTARIAAMIRFLTRRHGGDGDGRKALKQLRKRFPRASKIEIAAAFAGANELIAREIVDHIHKKAG